MKILKQSTAKVIYLGPFVDFTDGTTPETGLAGTNVNLSKNGAAAASGSILGSHDTGGNYRHTLSAADTDTLGELTISAGGSPTSRVVREQYLVLSATAYNALVNGAGSPSFVRVSPNYTLKVHRNGTITPLSSREIKAGETVAIQFDFSEPLNGTLLTSVAAPTSDDANTTIDDYGINGVGDGGKGINVILDCTAATAGETPEISVSVTAGSLVYKASHTFTIVE